MLQLAPSIPVLIVENPERIPTGPGLALFLVDYGAEWNVIWGVAHDNGGEVWWVQNPYIRLQPNKSIGRQKKEREPNSTFRGFASYNHSKSVGRQKKEAGECDGKRPHL